MFDCFLTAPMDDSYDTYVQTNVYLKCTYMVRNFENNNFDSYWSKDILNIWTLSLRRVVIQIGCGEGRGKIAQLVLIYKTNISINL